MGVSARLQNSKIQQVKNFVSSSSLFGQHCSHNCDYRAL